MHESNAGFLGIVLALGAAFYLYNAQLTSAAQVPRRRRSRSTSRASGWRCWRLPRPSVPTSPRHGTYGTFEQLRADGAPALGTDRRGYTFQLELNGSQGFKATATPTDSNKQGWPTLSIDASMQIAER